MEGRFNDIDAYLDSLLKAEKPTLQSLFDKKLIDPKIGQTTALDIMGVQSRAIKGILAGSQKLVDVRNLIKLANFLQLPKEQIIELFLEIIEKNFPTNNRLIVSLLRGSERGSPATFL
ncbi:MAG: hypothetical protein LH609_22050 [Rudanella sp.]|nr:hypothetical protein [Rudanella sp.]